MTVIVLFIHLPSHLLRIHLCSVCHFIRTLQACRNKGEEEDVTCFAKAGVSGTNTMRKVGACLVLDYGGDSTE